MRRQMERDAADDIRHQLDDQFGALRDLIYVPDPSASGSNATPLGMKQREDAAENTSTDVVTPQLVGHDDYDQHVRELAFDKRAKPKDRTKTDEELALEGKEALEKAEKKRRKRMLGLPENESDEESGKGRGKRKRGADDLDDDFGDDSGDYEALGAGLDEDAPRLLEGEDADHGSEEEDDDDDEDGVWLDDEDDNDDNDEGSGDSDEEQEELVAYPSKIKKGHSKDNAHTAILPFTFPCPETHEEFLEIIKNVRADDVPTVVQRIRTLHHTSFSPENKFKLQVWFFTISSIPSMSSVLSRRWLLSLLIMFYMFHHPPYLGLALFRHYSLIFLPLRKHTPYKWQHISTRSFCLCTKTSSEGYREVLLIQASKLGQVYQN